VISGMEISEPASDFNAILTVRGKFCIRQTCYRVIRFIFVVGFLIMVIFGAIQKKHDDDYPYVQSDSDTALNYASGVCLEFSQCTSNCSTWTTAFTNNTWNGYTLQAKCSIMCSGACVTTCQVCQDNCVINWNRYYDVVQHVGSGTDMGKSMSLFIIGLAGFAFTIFLTPVFRIKYFRWYGITRKQMQDTGLIVDEDDSPFSVILLG
jgi:hypothetical protein